MGRVCSSQTLPVLFIVKMALNNVLFKVRIERTHVDCGLVYFTPFLNTVFTFSYFIIVISIENSNENQNKYYERTK